jgi:hypothetical protein
MTLDPRVIVMVHVRLDETWQGFLRRRSWVDKKKLYPIKNIQEVNVRWKCAQNVTKEQHTHSGLTLIVLQQ